MEIDITYDCNLSCKYCNRYCDIIKTKEFISLETLEEMKNQIKGTKEQNRIDLLGGEPLLHPQIFDIINLFLKDNFTNNIIIKSNGTGKEVNDIIEKLKIKHKTNITYKDIITTKEINNSNPDITIVISVFNGKKVKEHRPIMVAPRDYNISYKEYFDKCWVPNICGKCFNNNGFYLCSNAANIDRIFNFKLGVKNYPTKEELEFQKKRLCGFCSLGFQLLEKDFPCEISKSWSRAYDKFKSIISPNS